MGPQYNSSRSISTWKVIRRCSYPTRFCEMVHMWYFGNDDWPPKRIGLTRLLTCIWGRLESSSRVIDLKKIQIDHTSVLYAYGIYLYMYSSITKPNIDRNSLNHEYGGIHYAWSFHAGKSPTPLPFKSQNVRHMSHQIYGVEWQTYAARRSVFDVESRKVSDHQCIY